LFNNLVTGPDEEELFLAKLWPRSSPGSLARNLESSPFMQSNLFHSYDDHAALELLVPKQQPRQ